MNKYFKPRFYFLLIFALTFNYVYSQRATSPEALKVAEYVRFLASDELEGRYPGTQGNYRAAEYIENLFKQFGLKPLENSYKQEFPFPVKYIVSEKNSVVWEKLIERPGLPREMWKAVPKQWKVGVEFQPLAMSENGTVTGEVVFCWIRHYCKRYWLR
jgi:hypothetical protein